MDITLKIYKGVVTDGLSLKIQESLKIKVVLHHRDRGEFRETSKESDVSLLITMATIVFPCLRSLKWT